MTEKSPQKASKPHGPVTSGGPPELEQEQASALSISIPPWFPRHLVDTARSLHRRAFEHGSKAAAIVERLVKDAAMEAVWKELTRRNRNSGQPQKSPRKFVHQVF